MDDQPNISAEQTREFVRTFSEYATRLRAYVLTLTIDPNDADELFQNTSCLLWLKYGEYQPGTNFLSWACRIAYLEYCNYRRSKGRRPILDSDVVEKVAAEAEVLASQTDLRRASLQACLEQLGEADQHLVRMRYEKQWPVREISSSLSVSIHSVYRSLNRIYDNLLACIDRRMTLEEGS